MVVFENKDYKVINHPNEHAIINTIEFHDDRLSLLGFGITEYDFLDINEMVLSSYIEKIDRASSPFIDIIKTYGNLEDIFLPLTDCGYIVRGIYFNTYHGTLTIYFNNNLTSEFNMEFEHFKNSLLSFGLSVKNIFGCKFILSYE